MLATRANRVLISTAAAVFLMVGCKGSGSSSSIPQSLTNWIWESGSQSANGLGYYVSLGSATANGQPSGRSSAMAWKDANGQFWVFSGAGGANDMWKFNTTTLQWAWMSGASSTSQPTAGVYPANPDFQSGGSSKDLPGQRNSGSTWTDSTGKLWMFGGYGTDSNGSVGYLNDMWSFDPATNWWSFVSGGKSAGSLAADCNWSTPGQPSPRNTAASWTDPVTGNFYMFGGEGYLSSSSNCGGQNSAGLQNDLWKFSPSNQTWAWLGGAKGFNAAGSYGKLNVSSASNFPGARQSAITWTDQSGIFWMFGGSGIDMSGNNGLLGDLWKYDPTAGLWTWVNGASTINSTANYGTNAIAAATNQPGARYGGLGWVDNSKNLWLFGGYGINSSGQLVVLNDLWEYQSSLGQWVWINGSYNGNVSGYYGTITVLGNGNTPGSRYGASGWTDSSGNFWMYGGQGYDSVGTNGHLGDTWKFLP